MNTERLEQLLGDEYTRIVQHTAQEALQSIAER